MLTALEAQQALKAKGFYLGAADADVVRLTLRAVDAALAAEPKVSGDWHAWNDARRQQAFEQIVYRDAGIDVGLVDGLVGEQTRYARTVWDARRRGDKTVENWRDIELAKDAGAAPKAKARWPRQADVLAGRSIFGRPGDDSLIVKLTFPYPMRIAWEPERLVTYTYCHKLVKEPFERILTNVLKHYGPEEIARLRMNMFGGLRNVRKMRGGSQWSMHAFACALDMDPDRNQLKFKREQATLDDAPYKPFWKAVYDEGFIGLGPECNFDWMHVQAPGL